MTAGDVLLAWVQRGVLSPLDRHFARAVGRVCGETRPEVLLGAALASRAVQRGHVCADLQRLHAAPMLDADEQPVTDVALPPLDAWRAALQDSAAVGDGSAPTPLVLAPPHRLYLYRYAHYERRLAADLRTRLGAEMPRAAETAGGAAAALLDRLFPDSASGGEDRHRRAAEAAWRRRCAVIAGGPGTGKTSTVARILVLLQERARAAGLPLERVLLLAPTGKAAQRLGESIARELARIEPDAAIAAAIPRQASTIHRALGWRPRTPTRFRHDAAHPLPADVVLVDEASMVDLALMAKLVAAVPPAARLILLGDRDQLASVEAGAIFGDICGGAPPDHPCIVSLTRSYRYAADSSIAVLARAINAGDADAALAALERRDGVELIRLPDADGVEAALAPLLEDGFAGLAVGGAEARVAQLERFRVLCAHRRGARGAEEINARIERHLQAAGLLVRSGEWYDGRPVMVVRNDYQLDLFNGDTGVITTDGAQPRAWFPSAGGLRSFAPARLPVHETVFAMTVHKSQGSELDHVALVLPEEPSPVLTRELLYTAVTRARRRVTVLGTEDVLRAAIAHRIERASGLAGELWGSRRPTR